jgi:hypothetical protein
MDIDREDDNKVIGSVRVRVVLLEQIPSCLEVL